MDGRMDGWMDGWMAEYMDVYGCVYGWMVWIIGMESMRKRGGQTQAGCGNGRDEEKGAAGREDKGSSSTRRFFLQAQHKQGQQRSIQPPREQPLQLRRYDTLHR